MSDQERTNPCFETAEFQPGDRLWTPWRMQYVAGSRESGCVFCNRLAESDDVGSLILHRGPRSFAIMNLFPYNTGHAMILPNDHVASPEDLDDETTLEMARYLPVLLGAARRALGPGGFNVGMNLGSIAGAGIASHLHQHIVPRWQGDANFMPVLANTKALPELLPITYAKIRAELERTANPIPIVALTEDRRSVFVTSLGELPVIRMPVDDSLWSAGQATLAGFGLQSFFLGWGGSNLAGPASTPALIYQAEAPIGSNGSWLEIHDHLDELPGSDRQVVSHSLRNLRDER